MRRVAVFGSTGSVGESTLDLLARRDDIEVVALTGGRNVRRLAEQARAHNAALAVTAFDECYQPLKDALEGTGIEVAAGSHAVVEAAHRPADWVMSAIVGAAGLAPGFAALSQGRTLALANKESLVTAGPLLLAEARSHGATILPVDSEHSAVFQALAGEDIAQVETVTLTASGGGLRDWPLEKLAHATPDEAGKHPNWDMGQRITIDSASMFNKAMEVIEAHEFFGLAPDQVKVLIHPQSLVHALVAFNDGAVMAHLGAPDMRHPIGYALNWPQRDALPIQRLDLAAAGRLDFAAPDLNRYPALALAWKVMETGGASGCVFNAAKEVALDHFIARNIGFLDMASVVEDTLATFAARADIAATPRTLDEVLAIDTMARDLAGEAAATRHRA
ncbi:1-deoxy-D-xylulose-5-phosphate reductoisomerase [Rhodobacter sp. NTK016B]|uniref:1-deoxy-D-xylulose-5-phosphate reductoisomerase n=1 Tax=Rhodobacter sp. NTK016B TaxID=2759676 RepID=UPI001A8E998D|nr:1-deoxy-D-xylulose-5-phosphate reductoisomerase [Rhodobacter sp. NTK016B]MBN8294046.1 1-deoxy-D-xylulose-5-phosphate reductoisomerase [Rhodobacter sp. NTK016B]